VLLCFEQFALLCASWQGLIVGQVVVVVVVVWVGIVLQVGCVRFILVVFSML
jgi:hypothetical protein